MRNRSLFVSFSASLLMTACGSHGIDGLANPACVPGTPSPASHGDGITLPADWPIDLPLPPAAYSVTGVYQQEEVHLSFKSSVEQLLAEIRASLLASGWSASSDPRSNMMSKGCRFVSAEVSPDLATGASTIVMRTSYNGYRGCLSGGNDKDLPPDGEKVSVTGKLFADIKLPASVQLIGPVKQQNSIMFLVKGSLDTVYSGYRKALSAACWDVPKIAYPGGTGAAKGNRRLIVSVNQESEGTQLILTLDPPKPPPVR